MSEPDLSKLDKPTPMSDLTSSISFGLKWNGTLINRPSHGALVHEIIARWAYLEMITSLSLALLLDVKAESAIQMLQAVKNNNLKIQMIRKALNVELKGDEKFTAIALLNHIGKLTKTRNIIVHDVWAESDKFPDIAFSVKPIEILSSSANHRGSKSRGEIFKARFTNFDNVTAFSVRSLENILEDVNFAIKLMSTFNGAQVAEVKRSRDYRFHWLREQSQIYLNLPKEAPQKKNAVQSKKTKQKKQPQS